MFDAISHGAGKRRLGLGTSLSVVFHVGLVAALVWLSTQRSEATTQAPQVTFFATPPPPPPPPAGGAQPKVEPKRPKPRPELVAPQEVPQELPPEPTPTEAPSEAAAEPGGVEGGVEGGVAGGTVGGTVGGVLGGTGAPQPPPKILQYDNTMPKLEFVGGPNVGYTQAALEHEVEGVLELECVVTVEGRVTGCRVLKSLRDLTTASIRALEARRYKPILVQGVPTAVYYRFSLKFELPD